MSEQQDSGFKPVAPMPDHKDSQSDTVAHEPSGQHVGAPMPAPMTGLGTNSDGSTIKQSSVLAVLALIGGIISLLMPLLALPSLIVSILGLKQTAGNKQSGRGMAIAGLVMSIIGMLSFTFWAVLFIVGLASSKNAANTVSSSSYSSSTSSSLTKKTITGTLKTPLQADRYSLTVNSIDHGYTPSKSYYTPVDGSEYVIVSITVKNNDTYAHSFSSYDFKIRDSAGVEHSDKFMTDIPNELSYKSVPAGQELTGNIVFELPVSQSKLVLLYDPGYFSDQQAEVSL